MILFRIACLLCFFSVCSVSAQSEATIWCFGHHAGIDFTSGTAQPLTETIAMATVEGCASISDNSGHLLFYTNGTTIWNRNHREMSNGTGLAGRQSAAQAAIIIPQPEQQGRYYIFTLGAVEQMPIQLHFSIVDMSADNGSGAVIEKNQQLLTSATEKITAVHHANARDLWVVAHELGNNRFVAFLVTSSGISDTVVSDVGSLHSSSGYHASGYMKFSPDGKKLAVAIRDDYAVELFDFDPSTGMVLGSPLRFTCLMRSYGVEFSPDNTKLYISSGNASSSGQLEQYDLTAGDYSAVLASRTLLGSSSSEWWGALQLGPDQKIYMAKYEARYLGVISNPNAAGMQAGFVDNGFFLGEARKSMLGLPGFVQSSISGLMVRGDTTICEGDTVQLQATGAVSYLWSPAIGLDNPTSATPMAFPSSTTTYTVTGYNANGGTVQRQVTIVVTPLTGVRVHVEPVTTTPGTHFDIPVVATAFRGTATVIDTLVLTFTYNPLVLDIGGSDKGRWNISKIGSDHVFELALSDIVFTPPYQTLATLRAHALFSTFDHTTIQVKARSFRGKCLEFQQQDGELALTGYCFGFNMQKMARAATRVSPVPASDVLAISTENLTGTAYVSLYTMAGTTIVTEEYQAVVPKTVFRLNVDNIPSGSYILECRAAGYIYTELVQIMR